MFYVYTYTHMYIVYIDIYIYIHTHIYIYAQLNVVADFDCGSSPTTTQARLSQWVNPKADPTELFTLSRAGSRPSPVNIVPKDAAASEPRKVDEPSDNTLGAEAQPIMDSVLIDYKVLDLQSGPSVTKISQFPVFTPVQRTNNADLPSGRHHSSPRQLTP